MIYLETTIEVTNKKNEDILGFENIMYVDLFVDFNMICAVREIIDDNDNEVNPEKCQIYLKSGEYFTIFTSYKEIVKHLKINDKTNG
jgi:hypothetical protein